MALAIWKDAFGITVKPGTYMTVGLIIIQGVTHDKKIMVVVLLQLAFKHQAQLITF